jgi:hypothetical protein
VSKSEAFLVQAINDLKVFRFLYNAGDAAVSECDVLHSLQMALEKLSKAILLHGNAGADVLSHVAIKKIQHTLFRADLARSFKWKRYADYTRFLRRILPFLIELERLCPALAVPKEQMPNLEYPWESRASTGEIVWIAPAAHRFHLLMKLRRPDGQTLLWMLENLSQNFSRFFN